MSKLHKTRVLFVGNSQSTSAGLDDKFRWSNYPSLVQEHFPQLECRYWLMSSLSVVEIDNQFNEVVAQHRPDFVILHPGIIEGSLRILPTKLKELFRVLPGGRLVTGAIYRRRKAWCRFWNGLGIRFFEVNIKNYEKHLNNIAKKCNHLGYKLILMTVPPLPNSHEHKIVPGNNKILDEYNNVMAEVAKIYSVPVVDTFANNTDPTRESLYAEIGGVHFSRKGHELITQNVINCLQNYITI